MATWDSIVIGGGIEGSSTAWQLARNGHKTLLLEQFPLPHTRGSSHGASRIIRHGYAEPFYVEMMMDAYKLWREIERESGIALYRKVGILTLECHPYEGIKVMESNLAKFGVYYKRLGPRDLKKQFPMLTYPNQYHATLEDDGGILRADQALKTIQSLFSSAGGTIEDGEKVVNITPGHLISVHTKQDTYKTKNLVVAAGPWTNKLLEPLNLKLPLQPLAINVLYWKEKEQGEYSPGRMPCFIHSSRDRLQEFYGLPCEEYPGLMKVDLHTGRAADPDARDANNQDQWDVKLVAEFLQKHLPGLEDKPSVMERCMYTVTPDHNFILDRHPKYENIVIGAGFSGTGFKLGPVVGKVLAELVMQKAPSHNLYPFKIDRFSKSKL
ncbi:peroxisomal sarcosine oxidase-like [Lingula anatina]|uniref:sarcosine oxidasee (formaldehyde-forming) n=1 Tax=Lingula anatina TaxID=7574 RepID=A0A1S3KH20_LINAN|nr:peroxisomal sarcosine oxidase-like [Lingula anatina]|eukprot:XP_013421787.1 peroxisomal sarcosine oxidase-like [Lingula anatina]